MAGDLHEFLARDHERLDELLGRCVRADGTIDREPYEQFREGLLRHIAIEERILFPVARHPERMRGIWADGRHGEPPYRPAFSLRSE